MRPAEDIKSPNVSGMIITGLAQATCSRKFGIWWAKHEHDYKEHAW